MSSTDSSEILNFCAENGIDEILHFTTSRGLVGIMSVGAMISRSQLKEHETLDFLSPENAPFRSDKDWTDYINLSITRINYSFFGYCKSWRHNELAYWIILAFKSEILAHPGVLFTTTNNIYTGSVKRMGGVAGLKQCFLPSVLSKYNRAVCRTSTTANNWTTCAESEVLYFDKLPLEYLSCIYVEDSDTYVQVRTTIETLTDRKDIEVIICPDKFKGC